MFSDFAKVIHRAEKLLDRVEALLPAPPAEPDWKHAIAFRWRKRGLVGSLQTVAHPHRIRLLDLQNIDEQKAQIERNTRQFLAGLPANNVLLTGSRGTGKSSLVKAVLHEHAAQGLRLVEVDKGDLLDLPDIVERLAKRSERFIIFCDDLSFDANEPGYKALKVVLDGSISGSAENVLIYATSNRRHLMPEFFSENEAAKHVDGEVHPAEGTEEKISLSERFGLWVSFYPFSQDEYLAAVRHWLAQYQVRPAPALDREALLWALSRGSRSGRVAWQFARDRAGQLALKKKPRR